MQGLLHQVTARSAATHGDDVLHGHAEALEQLWSPGIRAVALTLTLPIRFCDIVSYYRQGCSTCPAQACPPCQHAAFSNRTCRTGATKSRTKRESGSGAPE